jgi:hypothetical protein
MRALNPVMTRGDYELTEQAKQRRQSIQEHLDKVHRQRKLIAELGRKGKDSRPSRHALRDMLVELESILSDHHNLAAKSNQEADVTP